MLINVDGTKDLRAPINRFPQIRMLLMLNKIFQDMLMVISFPILHA